jgi:16S rRNA U516 pseudouridylate synthase RsuA-like enzyme
VDSLEELWDKYVSRKFLAQLSFIKRKRLMGLMFQFIVQMDEEVAQELGEPYENRSILRLRYPSIYDTNIGLSLVVMNKPLAEQFI